MSVNLHRVTNNAIGLVQNNPLTNSGTNLIVNSSLDNKLLSIGSFPFWLTLWSNGLTPDTDSNVEIVEVTARVSPNNYTITRAQQSTVAVQHDYLSNVGLLWTKGNGQEVTTLDAVDKGTIIAYDATGLPHAIPAGADGEALFADSTETYGLAYRNIVPDFGDGTDGDVTISAPTTISRDMYYNNLVLNDVLTTDGYRVFVKGTISGAGTIKWGVANNGGNASGTTGGTAGAAGGTGPLKNIAGVNGGNQNANGNGGTASARSIGTTGVAGGNGIDNGGGTPSTGGVAGTRTATIQKFGIFRWLTIATLDLSAAAAIAYVTSSAGSGSGSGSNTVISGNAGAGGASGATGGIVFLAANNWAGTFTIHAVGGNGGNGSNGTGASSAFGGGAGSGGSGGVAVVIYSLKTWAGSYNVAGGSAGTPGSGNAFTGNAGNTGVTYEIDILSLM